MTRLALIFGDGSKGSNANERAASSSRIFVRSHMQLALDSEEATGRRLTASEALAAFGLDILEKVVDDGGTGLVTDPTEPARSLRERRLLMRLSPRALASAAGVGIDEVKAAETPGKVSPIRTLEKIAQALALDERRIGLAGEVKGDRDLVTRLREMRDSEERDESFVAALADAAWVIHRQNELSQTLKADRDLKSRFTGKSGVYNAPVWKRGYDLAETTREILEIDPAAPIESVDALAQDHLGIPVVDTRLERGVAGATILNGSARGIALNVEGANSNVLVRRMTIAHELGHLLWDPVGQLERVRVDNAADVGRRELHDPVEARANAFAVAFLAPRTAVKALYKKFDDAPRTVAELVGEYGISASAAAHHLANICNVPANIVGVPRGATSAVLRKWNKCERLPNLITAHVPPSRGSRFALLTLQAARRRLISVETAAAWLKLDKRYLIELF